MKYYIVIILLFLGLHSCQQELDKVQDRLDAMGIDDIMFESPVAWPTPTCNPCRRPPIPTNGN